MDLKSLGNKINAAKDPFIEGKRYLAIILSD